MKKIRKILFVSQGLVDESGALQQALSLARNHHASLRVLLVLPQFPPALAAYRERFETLQRERFDAELTEARAVVGLPDAGPPVAVIVQQVDVLAVRIVQHLLKNGDDLLIKAAEPGNGHRAISAVDLDLLRLAPVPVWLARPIERHRGEIRVAVAIDPLRFEPPARSLSSHLLPIDRDQGGLRVVVAIDPLDSVSAARGLSLRLLREARELADTASGELGVISCWDYAYEKYLRHNVWIRMSDREIDDEVMKIEGEHRAALEALIKESGIGGKLRVLRARGEPAERIPDYVSTHGVDVLVLGTVARTGIQGFLMGNTAERILQSLTCSLVAFKPEGFVSPVRVD